MIIPWQRWWPLLPAHRCTQLGFRVREQSAAIAATSLCVIGGLGGWLLTSAKKPYRTAEDQFKKFRQRFYFRSASFTWKQDSYEAYFYPLSILMTFGLRGIGITSPSPSGVFTILMSWMLPTGLVHHWILFFCCSALSIFIFVIKKDTTTPHHPACHLPDTYNN